MGDFSGPTTTHVSLALIPSLSTSPQVVLHSLFKLRLPAHHRSIEIDYEP